MGSEGDEIVPDVIVSVAHGCEARVDTSDNIVDGSLPSETSIGVMLVFFDAFGVPDDCTMEASEELIVFDDDGFGFAPKNVRSRDMRCPKLVVRVIKGVFILFCDDGGEEEGSGEESRSARGCGAD